MKCFMLYLGICFIVAAWFMWLGDRTPPSDDD